jgi:uncharacterized protein YijF (DUF1287 family)
MVLRVAGLTGVVLVLSGISLSQSPPLGDCVDVLISTAVERTKLDIRYDGSYRRIPYPGGDVPNDVGVCTDLIVRSYRAIGVDLQKEVHEDMIEAFSEYPRTWGLNKPDPNIDHRRVGNLRAYLERHGERLPVSGDPADYSPGDLVTWLLPGNLSHIGIVAEQRTVDKMRRLIVHNIGRGPAIEDILFEYPITGHYRYCPYRRRAPDS